jgi:hypothetical protein
MLRTVDFDDPLCARCIDIDEVGTEWFLAVERDIGQLLAANGAFWLDPLKNKGFSVSTCLSCESWAK